VKHDDYWVSVSRKRESTLRFWVGVLAAVLLIGALSFAHAGPVIWGIAVGIIIAAVIVSRTA
jgi:predicted lipid-binding transport protein (Tim44 family)